MAEQFHEPTQEEIKAMTAEIRKDWSDKEYLKRAGYAEGRPVFFVPVASIFVEGRRL